MNRDLQNYQEEYARQPYEKYQVAFRKRKISEILARYRHDTMLEIGCGLQPVFESVDTYKDLVIVEPATLFYENAITASASYPNKNIRVINATLEEAALGLKDKRFDFILLSSLLHEIPDQAAFLGALHNIASNETVIHINVPNARSFHRLLAVEMGLITDVFAKSASNVLFQQQTVFDMELLTNLVHKNGFEVIESGSYSFKPFTHGQMQAMIDAKLMTELMLEGFYNMEKHLPGMGSEIYLNVKIA